MQHIDSIKLFPYLQHNSLLSDDDMEYICNPRRTENERRRRIIISAPCRDPDAFDRFVDCLSVEHSHPGHTFLAKRMREAIKKKRENPFSETLIYNTLRLAITHVQCLLISLTDGSRYYTWPCIVFCCLCIELYFQTMRFISLAFISM